MIDSSFQDARIRGEIIQWRAEEQLRFSPQKASHLALWLDQRSWIESSPDFAASLNPPDDARQTILENETIWVGNFERESKSFFAAAVPVKDFEAWEVRGALFLLRPAPSFRQSVVVAIVQPSIAAALFALIFILAASGRRKKRAAENAGKLFTRGEVFIVVLLCLAWSSLAAFESLAETDSFLFSLEKQAEVSTGNPLISNEIRSAKFALQGVRNIFLAWHFIVVLLAALLFVLVRFVIQNLSCPGKLRRILAGYGFIAPAGLHLLIFSLGPILFALYISFHAWGVLTPERPFVGGANYQEAIASAEFWNSLKNTAIFALHVPFGMAVSLGLAMLMNRTKLPGLGVLRTIFYLPSITSFVAIAIVWQWIYNPDFGLMNYALSFFGIGPGEWLHSPRTALLSLMLMAVWVQAGYQMVIFLAGLQNIPAYLYEAATIDGANAWQQFWRITFPMLRPTTFFILVTSMIGSFQVFTQVYVMTEGGPLQATEVIVYYIYKNAWDYLRMGYASAVSFILFAIIMALTWAQFKMLGKRQEIWQ